MEVFEYLDDAGLVHYTEGLNQLFFSKEQGEANKTELDSIKEQISSLAGASELQQLQSEVQQLQTNSASKEYVKQITDKIGTVKGSCTKSDLEGKKATANPQDIWIVTDDDNHLYIYVDEENGFIDLGTHIDDSLYARKAEFDTLNQEFSVAKGDISTLKSQLEGLESTLNSINTTFRNVL